jgi:2-polyprenyl-3-methyl-5-hydroxy-6-metoxy-1,4-benzoquinol methylase
MNASAVKSLMRRIASAPFRLLPRRVRRQVIRAGIVAACTGTPKAALRELLQVERDLSGLIDQMALRYDGGDGGVHVKHRLTRYHEFFVDRVRPNERVLDVGCGYGAVAYSLATRAGAIVVGIDLDPRNVAEARRRFSHSRLTFVTRDATRGWSGERFDVIVASNVIEHIAHRVEFYLEITAQACPSRWLVRVPMIDRDWRVPLRKELGLFYFSDPTHQTEYTRESFELEVHEAGFEVAHLQTNWGEIWAELKPHARG